MLRCGGWRTWRSEERLVGVLVIGGAGLLLVLVENEQDEEQEEGG